jgi:hypothetical protein
MTIVRPLMLRGFAVVALLLVAGCGHSIGDSCQTNVDCSPLGDRFCDIAPPGGYCTIEDCGPTSCPSEAACIRFFIPILNEACDTSQMPPFTRADCKHPDEICVCDHSTFDPKTQQTTCVDTSGHVNNSGHCAPASTEKHWCQKLCGNNGDCRQGYECRQTGTLGATQLPAFDAGSNPNVKFCAPIEPGNPPVSTL